MRDCIAWVLCLFFHISTFDMGIACCHRVVTNKATIKYEGTTVSLFTHYSIIYFFIFIVKKKTLLSLPQISDLPTSLILSRFVSISQFMSSTNIYFSIFSCSHSSWTLRMHLECIFKYLI